MSYDTDTVRAMWYETVTSGMSGIIVPPPNSIIVTELWRDSSSVLVSTFVNDIPNFRTPLTSGGTLVGATLDADGNYVLLNEPASYPIALLYIYEIAHQDFDKEYALFGRLYQSSIGLHELYRTEAHSFTLGPEYIAPVEDNHAVPKKYVDDGAVTLDDDADSLLSLTIQELGLDTQTANLAFMGPTTGDPAVPAFRSPQAKDVVIPGGVGSPSYDDMQDFLRTTRSAGRLTDGDGLITAYEDGETPDGKVSISEHDGMIFTTNEFGGTYIYFKQVASLLDLTGLADNSVFWIYFDWNSGTPQYAATTDRTDVNEYDQFTVGRVWRSGTTVEVMQSGHNLYDKDRRAHNRLILKYGNMDRISGGVISAHATALRLSCTAGIWYVANTPFSTELANTFKVIYKTGSAVWVTSSELTLFSDIFNGAAAKTYETYQNGNDLAALTANFYGVYWIFICPEGDLYVVLGTSKYANIGLAQAATVPSSLPPYCVDWGNLIGRVIIKNSAAAFYSVESIFSTQFTLSAVVDHNSIGGLQGGTAGEYYHLLLAEYTELSEWLDDVTLGSNGLTSVPELVLVPRAAALSDVQGGMYYSNVDDSVYVCTSAS